jgi:hypothetical protein
MYQWPVQVTLIDSSNTEGSPAELGFVAHDFPEEPPQTITIYDVSWVKTEPRIPGPVLHQASEPGARRPSRVCYRSCSSVTAGFRRYLNTVLTNPYSARRLAIQPIN